MNSLIRMHNSETEDPETGEVLNNAVNVSEQRIINDTAALIFDYPMDEKGRMITQGKICTCNGRNYEVIRTVRNMTKTDVVTVTCRDLFSRRAKARFIPTIPDKMGVKIKEILSYVIDTYAGEFTLFTDAELAQMGMEWVSDEFKIDVFVIDKTNLWEFTKTVIENLGRGEIYAEGYKFAIVERIGCDRGVRLSLHKNMQNISIERSTENIVTRLYPFGADDMPITSVNGDVAYIDSPNKALYGIKEGYRDYSDYTDPEKLLMFAKWEFDPRNEDRIDIPRLTISGRVVDLSKLKEYGDIEKIELGDTVHVIDNDGTEYTQRVIEGTWYPYEAKETSLSIGHIQRSLGFTLYQLLKKMDQIDTVQTTSKGIATRKMSGTVNTDRNNVRSENELFKIISDLLEINDTKRVRIRLGNYRGEFVFIIYDKDGNEAIYLDENGEAVFAGTIETMRDCLIQGELRVGLGGNNAKGISFYGTAYTPDENGNYSKPYARILPWTDAYDDHIIGINIEGGLLCVGNKEVATKEDIQALDAKIRRLNKMIEDLK